MTAKSPSRLPPSAAGRVTIFYDLMDSAHDVAAIRQHSRDLNHVLIIDINPRATPGLKAGTGGGGEAATPCRTSHMAEQVGYGERSAAERGQWPDERLTTAGEPCGCQDRTK